MYQFVIHTKHWYTLVSRHKLLKHSTSVCVTEFQHLWYLQINLLHACSNLHVPSNYSYISYLAIVAQHTDEEKSASLIDSCPSESSVKEKESEEPNAFM